MQSRGGQYTQTGLSLASYMTPWEAKPTCRQCAEMTVAENQGSRQGHKQAHSLSPVKRWE